MIILSENLEISSGIVNVATAETGSAAVMDAKPEAQIDANGKVTIIQPETAKEAETKTQTTTNATETKEKTGETATAEQNGGGQAFSSSGGAETAGSATTEGAEGTATEGVAGEAGTKAGAEAGGSDAYTEDMAKDAGIIGADGSDVNGVNGGGMDGMHGMDGMGTETGSSFSVTQSVPAMAGITAGVLALAILAGIVLAKLKIKKGINLYED